MRERILGRYGAGLSADNQYTSAVNQLQAWVSPVAEPQQEMAKEELHLLEDLPGAEHVA